MEHVSQRDVSRIIPGGNAEPSTFFETSSFIYAIFMLFWRQRIPMHQFHLIRNMLFHLIFHDCEADYLKTDDIFTL